MKYYISLNAANCRRDILRAGHRNGRHSSQAVPFVERFVAPAVSDRACNRARGGLMVQAIS
jgi:hypothetical protein